MSASAPSPQRAGRVASLLSIFSTARHTQLALPHNLAAELESNQIASAYKSGAWPPADWVETSLQQSKERLHQLRRSLALSGALTVLLAVVGLAAAVILGKIHFSLPLDYGKCVSAVGAGLAAWGTFLQFQQPPRTFRGTFIHEVIHSRAVRLFAVTGFTVALLGTLWW